MAIVIGSVIMLGGVTLQVCAANVGTVIGSRVIGEFSPAWLQLANSSHTPVGFGLSFAMNAAPLLVTELAYPTQVCIPAVDRRRYVFLISPRFSAAKSLQYTTRHGIRVVLSVS
jgi:hypothetical protein